MTDHKRAARFAANDRTISCWDRLADPEAAFLGLGPVWADPPPMHTWKGEPGRSATEAIDFLLTGIETGTLNRTYARNLLSGCFGSLDQPVALSNIHFLDDDGRKAMLAILNWVAIAGGLRLPDFPDGGERFLRLVLRKRPQTIVRLLARQAA